MPDNGWTNLINRASERGAKEDATTEAFAELLRSEPAARSAFLEVLAQAGVSLNSKDTPRVRTQVGQKDSRLGESTVFADLVLEWTRPRTTVVVEVKTGSGLSGTRDDAENQPLRYQRVFSGLSGDAQVVLLADRRHPNLGDGIHHVTWQRVHDALVGVQQESRWIARFIAALKELGLATELTMQGVLSVMPYRSFYDAFVASLQAAQVRIEEDGLLSPFKRPARMQLQDAHERLGYWFPLDGDSSKFVFLGMYYGDDVWEPQIPELYWFLEVPADTAAAKALDAQADEIEAALKDANAEDDGKIWAFEPNGYQAINCVMNLLDVAREDDPREAIYEFYRGCFEAVRNNGLLERFSNAAALTP